MRRRDLLAGSAASLAAATSARAQPAAPSGGETVVELRTELGALRIALSPAAPLTAANFLRYVDTHRLDGAAFYRAARARGVEDAGLIEGGLRNDPARLLPPVAHESTAVTGLRHADGAVSMARDAPGTATADFFVCAGPAAYLDARVDDPGYAVFGRVTDGMDVVRAILAAPTGGPADNPVMQGQMLDHPVRIVRAVRLA